MNTTHPLFIYLGVVIFLFCISCGSSDPSENTELLRAIRQNNTEKIAKILTQNPKLLNQKTIEEGLTPLHVAAKRSKVETVKILLAKGAEINEPSKNKNTALHFAAENFMNNYKVMQLLLQEKANFKLKNAEEKDIWECIYSQKKGAFFQKDSDLLTLLMRYGYFPDTTRNEIKKSVFHDLCERSESPEITEFFVEKYHLNPNDTDANGWTALHYAAKGSNYEVARILLKNGANVNAQSTHHVGSKSSKASRYSYPIGSTPRDIYMKQTHSKLDKSLTPLFEKNGGKRGKDI